MYVPEYGRGLGLHLCILGDCPSLMSSGDHCVVKGMECGCGFVVSFITSFLRYHTRQSILVFVNLMYVHRDESIGGICTANRKTVQDVAKSSESAIFPKIALSST